MIVSTAVVEEVVQDYDTSKVKVQAIARNELTEYEWQQGHHVGTRVVRGATPATASLQAQPHTARELVGATPCYVWTADNAELRVTGAFSIEATIRLANTAQSDVVIACKGTDYALKYTGGAIVLEIGGTDVGIAMPLADPFPMYHVGVSYDGHVVRGYINGLPLAVKPFVKTAPTSTAPFAVGAKVLAGGSADGHAASMIVQNVRLWMRGLTQAEIAQGVNGKYSGTETGLVLFWKLDDTAATAADATGRHPGTIVGSPAKRFAAYRQSPRMNCAVVRAVVGSRISWLPATQASGAAVTVQVSDNGADWTTVTNGAAIPLASLTTFGADLVNKHLWVRVFLYADGALGMPQLTSLASVFTNWPSAGDFTYVPTKKFASIDTAAIAALQQITVPTTWSMVAREPYGCRFKVFNPTTLAPSTRALADLTIRGPREPS
jgi:hypothetical protein